MRTRTAVHFRGFTIVELLTVAACISVSMSMLLPAVQDARDAQRRTQCMNNVKTIALAMHNYHDTYNGFPPGWVSRSRDSESEGGWGWQARLLPFMEQATLYNKLELTHPMTDADGMLAEAVSILRCPADDEAPKQNPYRGGYGLSSYSACSGTLPANRWLDGRMESFWPGSVPTFAFGNIGGGNPANAAESAAELPALDAAVAMTPNGLFGLNFSAKMRDITDGTSNTIIVSERSGTSGWSVWPGAGSNRFENDVVTDVSFYSPLNRSLTGFSSFHSGGVIVGICDGSVQFMSNEIDSRPEGGVLQYLGTRAGNEVISDSPFQQ